MGKLFEELDNRSSPLGDISLRRRRIPALGDRDIYEVKLGEEFLMSSMFVDAEVALAKLGLAATNGTDLRVVVGGLGLGYTACAALENSQVRELSVIEALEPVIDWHRLELVPNGAVLNVDSRCRYIHANFFDLAAAPGRSFTNGPVDAVLLDIDHSPSDFLNSANAAFYTPHNLAAMARQIRTGGVFAMWSNEASDDDFIKSLQEVFQDVQSHTISFFNPFQNGKATNTVYVARAR